ncbi:MAG: hypothetical protein EP343_23515 [Deltaproteobacteria bacterium]|nr:MAG: hypothetical protein EP343_23515 [Deltaproteobacteria bacterium]
MGMGTAGAVLDAISRQKQITRATMGDALARFNARLLAKQEYNLRMLEADPAEQERLQALLFEEFECYRLCDKCGHLGSEEEACPSCGSQILIDLQNVNHAFQIYEMEEESRQHTPLWVYLAPAIPALYTGYKGMGLFVLPYEWSANSLFFKYLSYILIVFGLFGFFVAGALVGGATWWVGHRLLVRWLSRRWAPESPERWHAPFPQPNQESPIVEDIEGRCQTSKEDSLLQAPFSGRKCLAYRVALFREEPVGIKPISWLLDEQKTTSFSLNGTSFEKGKVAVDLPLTPLSPELLCADQDALMQWLRQRGLFLSEGGYTFCESILLPNQAVHVQRYAQPANSVPTLSAVGTLNR